MKKSRKIFIRSGVVSGIEEKETPTDAGIQSQKRREEMGARDEDRMSNGGMW